MSDDDAELMPKCFAVDNFDEELNMDIPPTSGQEYLRRVHLEAKKFPSVVVAEIDSTMLHTCKRYPVDMHLSSRLHPAPTGFSPSLEWQMQQAADFANVRQNLARYKARLKKEGIKSTRKLPLKENVTSWCKLCFGSLDARRDRQRRDVLFKPNMSQSSDDDTSSVEGNNVNDSLKGTPPLLHIIAHMDQPTVIQVLEYHVNWLEATGFTNEQGQWFYALLACLEKPLDPETCASLRTVARHCASLRATLDSANDSLLAPLNLLICLVSRYFGQSDLGDDG